MPSAVASSPIATPIQTTKFRRLDVTNTAVAVKASAGVVYAWNFVNLHSAAIFVKLFDVAAASVTPGTTVPMNTIQVAANGSVTVRGSDLPIVFGTALSVFVTTVAADTGSQTAAAALPILEMEYV